MFKYSKIIAIPLVVGLSLISCHEDDSEDVVIQQEMQEEEQEENNSTQNEQLIDYANNSLVWSMQTGNNDFERLGANAASTGNKAFLFSGGAGDRFGVSREILKFENNQWTALSDMMHTSRGQTILATNEKALIIGGSASNGAPTKTIYTFDFETEMITGIADFPYGTISHGGGAVVGNKGYVTKKSMNSLDFYMYDFSSNNWSTLQTDFLQNQTNAKIVSAGKKLFFASLENETSNFYIYDTENNQWKYMTDFPGEKRNFYTMLSSQDAIFIGFGISKDTDEVLKDVWKYNIAKDEWTQVGTYPGEAFHSGYSFIIEDGLYFGGGSKKVLNTTMTLNTEIYKLSVN
ncbi:Kelch repeat-containing protein [Aureivirga marina]|uniref:Kelch repeat-containing protein n=1 Tax=Aureivirga marina TaxID=1182451 RepID=UPI0018C98D00|nr:kelch repeat-containing protein [Aureivirga marina]